MTPEDKVAIEDQLTELSKIFQALVDRYSKRTAMEEEDANRDDVMV